MDFGLVIFFASIDVTLELCKKCFRALVKIADIFRWPALTRVRLLFFKQTLDHFIKMLFLIGLGHQIKLYSKEYKN